MDDARCLTILYRDEHYIAVDKPAGLLVHRTRLSGDREAAVQWLRDQVGARVHPVHRLDRPTSGVLLFGLSSGATAQLRALFEAGDVEKRYLAVVRGFTETDGTIDYPIRNGRGKARREARTRYRRLAKVEMPLPAGPYATSRYSLVAAWPLTGRMHQLRRHFAHIRHPILGDTTHGDGKQNRAFRAHYGIWRLMLMARSVGFRHPITGERLHIEAPLPPEFRAVAERFGWDETPARPTRRFSQLPDSAD